MTTYHYISESAPKFRIGGVYRNGIGAACKMTEDLGGDCARVAIASDGVTLNGSWSLIDGTWSEGRSGLHLIPGELTLRDGQWVPLEQTASLTFPSGACVQLAGDKIVGRVEAEAGDYSVSWESLFQPASAPIAPAIAPEPVRAPLDWNTTTRHDTFGPDFIVTKGAEPTAPLYDSPTTDSAYPAIAGLLRG